jgi:hypothetical protein
MKTYSHEEVADLLEQAQRFNIQLYDENTLADVEMLVKQELLKLGGNVVKWK